MYMYMFMYMFMYIACLVCSLCEDGRVNVHEDIHVHVFQDYQHCESANSYISFLYIHILHKLLTSKYTYMYI